MLSSAVTAYILSAGRGRRLGGVCKGRVVFNGVPLAVRQFKTMLDAGVARVNIVVGHEATLIRNAVSAAVPSNAPDTAMRKVALLEIGGDEASATEDPDIQVSVRCGLRDAKAWLTSHPDASGVLISLVDLPLLTAEDVLHLIEFGQTHAASVVIPVSPDQQFGHPIWLSRNVVMTLPVDRSDFSLREILRVNTSLGKIHIHRMKSNRLGYFKDLDTPDDIAQFESDFNATIDFSMMSNS